MIGPFSGLFREVTIKSIHNNFREFVDEMIGCSGCFNIKTNEKKFQLKKSFKKRNDND